LNNNIINYEENLKDILEYDIIDEEIKNKIINNKELNRKINKWIDNFVCKGHINAVKNCYIEYIDYDSLDFDNMDEFEIKSINRIIKKNSLECPNHRNCQMFLNNILKPGMKCPMELAECQIKTQKLAIELDIKKEDINDQILLSQLIGLNLIYDRSISGLSNAPLVTEIKKISNGSITYDTKINENFNIAKTTLSAIESLRKSLILNRDDKARLKQIKDTKTIEDVKANTSEIIKKQEDEFDINSIINSVIDVKEDKKINNEMNIEA
jgi:hypothetical protein